jgi:hypothetical protein
MEYIAGSVAMVITVTVVFTYLIVRMALQHEEKKFAMRAQAKGGDAALHDAQAEITNLQERVAVLERLATDEDRRLAGEIGRLQSAEVRR